MIEYILAFLALYAAVFYLLLYLLDLDRIREDPAKKRCPTITVIIPAYNEEATIGKTIESVLALDYPKDKLAITVVDDGSTDNTSGIAKRYNVTLIKKENSGKANSLNVALKRVKTELVAVLDADSYVGSTTLTNMLGYFNEPDVVAVTATMKVWKPRTLIQKMQRAEYLVNAFIKKLQSFIDGISVTPGPFSIYRKSVFDDIGFFDEDTLTEDQEFALRIQASNLRIENSINADVFTSVPDNLVRLFKQRRRWYMGYLQNIWKHRALFSPRYGDFGMFVLPIAVVILILTIASVIWAYSPRGFNISFALEPMPLSLIYLELTPTRLVFLGVFIINVLAVYYTLRNTRESGFLGSILSLFAISYMMLMLWIAVILEQAFNTLRGVRPVWKGD
ncbi:MAG: glycosyltransferase [Candidatus Micrarchaeota archaeon]